MIHRCNLFSLRPETLTRASGISGGDAALLLPVIWLLTIDRRMTALQTSPALYAKNS
jgi:hypothetical protein